MQAENGMWHTLVDDPLSPQESSATAGIAYGMLRGVRMGILDADVADSALRAWDALRDRIDERGIVLEASKGTMVGPDLQYYCDIAMAPVPYAQALMMLLLLELQQGSGWPNCAWILLDAAAPYPAYTEAICRSDKALAASDIAA